MVVFILLPLVQCFYENIVTNLKNYDHTTQNTYKPYLTAVFKMSYRFFIHNSFV